MGIEKIGDKLENTNGIENRTESLEKNIEIEKPESVEKQETAKNLISKLENNEYYSTRDERLAQTPRENGVDSKGTWQGERGESKYIPNDEKAQTILKEHGQDGIQYKDGIPNFTDVSIEEVKINDMHANRSETFRKADNECAQKWNEKNFEGKSDWTGKEVADWRTEKGYTWHECNDRKTCQLVPTAIHSKCGHLGGYAECKKRDGQP